MVIRPLPGGGWHGLALFAWPCIRPHRHQVADAPKPLWRRRDMATPNDGEAMPPATALHPAHPSNHAIKGGAKKTFPRGQAREGRYVSQVVKLHVAALPYYSLFTALLLLPHCDYLRRLRASTPMAPTASRTIVAGSGMFSAKNMSVPAVSATQRLPPADASVRR